MTFELLRAALTAHFQSGFARPAPTEEDPDATAEFFPVAWENRKFKQPASTWVRFTVRPGERFDASAGRKHKRTVGVCYLQIFTPEDGGTREGHEAADKFAEVFDNATVFLSDGSAIDCQAVTESILGKTGDGWHQTNASVSFRLDVFEPEPEPPPEPVSTLELVATDGETVIDAETDISE